MKATILFFSMLATLSSPLAVADEWDSQLINVSQSSRDSYDHMLLDAVHCARSRIQKYAQLFKDQLNPSDKTLLTNMVQNASEILLRKVDPLVKKDWYSDCESSNAYASTPAVYTGFIVICPAAYEKLRDNNMLCEMIVHELYHTTDNHEMPEGNHYPHDVEVAKEKAATMWQYAIMINTNPNGQKCNYVKTYGGEVTAALAKDGVGTPPLCAEAELFYTVSASTR